MKRGVWVLKFLLMGIAGLLLIGLVTQLLWNALIPQLFAGPSLTFLQALGLLALSKIFFWSFGKGGHRSHKPGWGYYWSEKWKGMSPDERERLKQRMKEKWCGPMGGSGSDSEGTRQD
jgi:hypothetical protein